MNRHLPMTWLLLSLLPACQTIVIDSNGSGGTAGTTNPAGGGGAGGATMDTTSDTGTSTSSTTPSDTTSSTGTTISTMSLPCMDFENPPPGSSYASDCPCAPEAEALLPIFAQAALAKFQSTGAVCATAFNVPAWVLTGMAYLPGTNSGQDFFTGDSQTGWVCLDIVPPERIHCRYRYTAGGDYLAPSLGGPDPGPGGFEVVAEADDDGDSFTSAFAIAGTLDPATGTMSLGPLFVHDPAE